MDWPDILPDDVSHLSALGPAIDRLLQRQREEWPLFRAGEAALAGCVTAELNDGAQRIVLQANPGRARSTHANVDPQAIARRPCFLCPHNMPAEERGLAWRDLAILPNPFPILPRHCTIASRSHRPQRLADGLETLLGLARGVGPDMVVFYNGPRCGASAPDHLHFQACAADPVPLWRRVAACRQPLRRAESAWGRSYLAACDPDARRLGLLLAALLERLRRVGGAAPSPDDEPLLNVVAGYGEGLFRCLAFPRAAHRPACFHREEPERIAVSPAALEMAGLLVAADPAHLGRLDATAVRAIYAEVSLPVGMWAPLLGDWLE